MEKALQRGNEFAKFCKEQFKVKSIYHFKEEHYKAFLESKSHTSIGNQRDVETALRKLQNGMRAMSEKTGHKPTQFCGEKRMTDWRAQEKPRNRSYTNEQVESIRESVSPNVRNAVDLAREVGLRVREVTQCRIEHFVRNVDEHGNKVFHHLEKDHLIFKATRENAAGVTKGGRPRDTPVPERFQERLQQLLANAKHNPVQRLVPITDRHCQDTIRAVCDKHDFHREGMHGFRHSYTRERLEIFYKEKGISETGPKMLERIMQNRDVWRKADYGINSKEDKQLFNQVKECLDRVQAEIGHGKGRWDLVERYCRD